LCVARRSDKVILASHVHTSDKSYDFAEKVKQTLNSPGWATVTTNRISLEDGGYLFFVLLDEVCLLRPNAWVPPFFLAADFFVSPPPASLPQPPCTAPRRGSQHPLVSFQPTSFPGHVQGGRVYIAVATRNYPSRFVYSEGSTKGILHTLNKEVMDRFADATLTVGPNGLNGKLAPLLKQLCAEYNDLKSIDKLGGVQAKVDAVTGVMRDNLSLAMRNNDRCAALLQIQCTSHAVLGAPPLPPSPHTLPPPHPLPPPLHPLRRIEDIDTKAEDLANSAKTFSTMSTNLKNSERCKLIRFVPRPPLALLFLHPRLASSHTPLLPLLTAGATP
jgi:hypothetical protein